MFLICAIISFLSHKSLSLSNIFSNDGYIHDPYQRYSVYNQQNQRHHHHDRDWLGTEPFILDSPQPRMIQSEPARWVDTMIYCPNFADKICEKLIKLCCIKGNCYIYNTFLLLLLLCLWLLPEVSPSLLQSNIYTTMNEENNSRLAWCIYSIISSSDHTLCLDVKD